MSEYDRQIQRCKDQQRSIHRLIDSCKRQIRESERSIQSPRTFCGGSGSGHANTAVRRSATGGSRRRRSLSATSSRITSPQRRMAGSVRGASLGSQSEATHAYTA